MSARKGTPRLAVFALLLGVFAALAAALPTALAQAATITIVNNDGATEGFNDPTVVAPVGGNPGTTRSLSVKLPRDKELPAQSADALLQTVQQVRELMSRRAGTEAL